MEEYYPPLHCKNINIAYNLKIEKLECGLEIAESETEIYIRQLNEENINEGGKISTVDKSANNISCVLTKENTEK